MNVEYDSNLNLEPQDQAREESPRNKFVQDQFADLSLLEKMKNKYLSRSDRVFIRRGFDRAMADRERWGIPSKS